MNLNNKFFITQQKGIFNKKQNLLIIVLVMVLLLNSFYLGYKFYRVSVLNSIHEQQSFEKIMLVQSILEDNYLFIEDVSYPQMFDGLIEGMVDSMGDPYTRYISNREYQEFKVDTQGYFGGIGVSISSNADTSNGLVIHETHEGQGAAIAGLLPNDRIIAVDGEPIKGMPANEATALIKGEIGTDVVLTVEREGYEEPLQITIKRQQVDIPVVDGKMIKDNIGMIKFTQFTETSISQFDTIYNELLDEGMDQLILDLRRNPGGLVDSSTKLLSRFLGENQVTVTTEKKNFSTDVMTEKSPYTIDVPTVVLVDQGTASASEIVAGALQDYEKATIIGMNTYGKGLVQEEFKIDNSSAIIMTVSKYLTPNGRDIHKQGIQPDVVEEFSKEEYIKGVDSQVEKAVEILSKIE